MASADTVFAEEQKKNKILMRRLVYSGLYYLHKKIYQCLGEGELLERG